MYVRNDAAEQKTYRLLTYPLPGGFASFDQFDPTKALLDVVVPKRSSIARTVFVSRNSQSSTALASDAAVRVDVIELAGTTPVQAASVYLNADPTAPEIDSPEIDSREIFTPEIDSLTISSRTVGAPEIDSPEIDSPEIDSPEIVDVSYPGFFAELSRLGAAVSTQD